MQLDWFANKFFGNFWLVVVFIHVVPLVFKSFTLSTSGVLMNSAGDSLNSKFKINVRFLFKQHMSFASAEDLQVIIRPVCFFTHHCYFRYYNKKKTRRGLVLKMV